MKHPSRESAGLTIRSAATILTVCLLPALCGCPKPGDNGNVTAIRQEPAEDVIARVNANSQAMDFVLKASGSATGRVRGRDGKLEPFDMNAAMLFQRPGRLYMTLDHTLSGSIQIGSNENEFYVWEKIDAGNPRYLWGEHHRMGDTLDNANIPIRPDYLAEVFGLIYIPPPGTTAEGPFFRALPKDYELVFVDTTSGGRQYVSRAVRISRTSSDGLVREILFYRPDGYVALTAELSDYQPIKDGASRIPFDIRMNWADGEQNLHLKLGSASRHGNTAAAEAILKTTPRAEGKDLGYVERVDLAPLPTPAPSGGEALPTP